jgi:heat-inducible transcriptional repressor
LLTQRQEAILKAIIEDYVNTAEPVASKFLVKRPDISVSSATLRNEMADLEAEGFLKQPHTSAGRIPSDKGYRLFVDNLLSPLQPENHPLQLNLPFSDVDELMHHAVKMTAAMAQCTAIIRAPRHLDLIPLRIKTIESIRLDNHRIALILVLSNGKSETHLVELPFTLEMAETNLLNGFLNQHLANKTIGEIQALSQDTLIQGLERYAQVLMLLWEQLTQQSVAKQEKFWVSNAAFLAQQPEFTTGHKLSPLLSSLEEESLLQELLVVPTTQNHNLGLRIAIGQENTIDPFKECTVVSAGFELAGDMIGEVVVLGPTRFKYDLAIRSVTQIAQTMSHHLNTLYGLPQGHS